MADKKKYEQALPVGYKLTGGSHDYFIEQVLGQGGFGITYKVKARIKAGNIGIDAHFAVKEYFPSGCWRTPGDTMMLYAPTSEEAVKTSLKDFISEGHRLQQICNINSNIVSVNEVFEANGTAYFVMEYLLGGDIRKMVHNNGGAMSEDEMLGIITPVANAVQCLHDNNMLHLDIKPENIVMRQSEDGTHMVPVLIDFGIAVHFDEKGAPTTTSPSKGVTQGYSPVEQFAGITRFDPRFDVYSLSATCYYMLTGQTPKSAFDVTDADIRTALEGHASPSTIDAIAGGMCKDVVNRTPSVRNLLDALYRKEDLEPPLFTPTDDDEQVTRSLNLSQSTGSTATVSSGSNAVQAVSKPHEAIVDEKPKTKKRKIWIIAACAAAVLGLGTWEAIALLKGSGNTTKNDVPLEKLLQDTVYSEALLQKAQEGNAEAQNLLGICYYEGYGTEKDLKKAVEWYRKAAEQGNAESQYHLGYCYANGEGVEENQAKAAEWYKKAAEKGIANAQCNLAYRYIEGNGVPKDLNQAQSWYRKAAEQGDAQGQTELGLCYENGEGVEKDLAKAIEWYRKAAEQNYARAQSYLGSCYREGKGVKKDSKQAFEWYLKAAEQDYAGAQCWLGVCYHKGEGVEKNLAKAVEWYRKAAENGSSEAQYDLGKCYENGEGVKKDYKQAIQLYQKAAEQGFAPAQCSLGFLYYTGLYVKKDYKQAYEWWRKAAEQGDDTSQYNMGCCYENGEGVSKDLNKAIEWYQKAARQGYKDAQTALRRLGKSW